MHRSAQGRDLVAALGNLLSTPLADPFAAEVVAVPARGVERWLTQQLSHRVGVGTQGDGICARVDFPTPAALLDKALGLDGGPWEQTSWALVEVLDELGDEPLFAPVTSYLQGNSGRRYALATKLERLFGSYASNRPDLVAGWVHGDDGVPEDLRWQLELWRRLRSRLGTPTPAEQHRDACEKLRQDSGSTDLPERISLYGVSRISRARLDVLAAVAEHRDVHLFVHHPGASLWDEVTTPVERRAEDLSALALTNPLLASLSRDVRELQQRLLTAVPGLQTTAHDEATTPTTLLEHLQQELRTDAPPAAKTVDDSLQVHACHGPARQVEVLREALLRLLQDSDLQPRDVLVMCPDVETYAPLLTAAFTDKAHPGGALWVQIADRSPRQTNPLLGLAARLVELAGARVTGAEVLDLAGSTPVRRMFSLSDDDLEQLRGWVVGAHVHWGLDAEHRSRWSLQGFDAGTWRVGMDRLLAGVATQDLVGGLLPYDGLDSGKVAALGRFAEFVDRLGVALKALQGRQSAASWLRTLEEAVLSLGDVPRDGEWQKVQLARVLGDLQATDVELDLPDVAALLDDVLAGRPTRTSFRTGALTVCTLTPMRSVPHKVVCLLGMDDGSFPRHGLPDGDDLLARDPHLGERDPRSEDRQLFLDALLAAEKHLVITYTGADVRTGAPLPPAVPVGELLDVLPKEVVRRHPLQPFDPRNFEKPAFSFDKQAHQGAVAAQSRTPLPRALPLITELQQEVALEDLVAVLEHPGKAYLRQQLGVYATSWDEEPTDALPIDMGGLPEWKVGDRVLRGLLDGADLDDLKARERGRGEIPPGPLGEELLGTVGDLATRLVDAATAYRTTGERVDVDVTLPSGRRLVGSVPDVHDGTLLNITYSNLAPKHRLRAWVHLLALAAHDPSRQWEAVSLGKGGPGRLKESRIAGIAVLEAPHRLQQLLELRDAALREPLVLPVKTAAEYAEGRRDGKQPSKAWEDAVKKWEGDYDRKDGERLDDDWELVGATDPWTWTPQQALPGIGHLDEPCAFATLAMRVWRDLLLHESVNVA